MKIKLIVLIVGLLTVFSIFSLGFVSAALELKSINPPTTISHNQGTIPITYTLTNSGSAQTELDWTDSTTSLGSWANLNTLPNTINSGATLQFTAVLSFPKQRIGSIQTDLKVESKEGETDHEAVSINIARSASLSIAKTKELTSIQDGVLTVTNTGNVQLNNIELNSSGNINVIFSRNNFNLGTGDSPLIINVSGVDLSNLKFGTNNIGITAKDLNENAASNTINFVLSTSFCKAGEKGDLVLKDVSIETDGDDEDVWKPLDVLTVEVEVENEGDDEVQDVIVELGFFDSNGNNFADDFDYENDDEEKIDLGDLNDGDEEIVTFKFKIPADFDERGSFKLAIKAYSDDEEELHCADRSSDLSDDFFEDIEIESEDDEGKFIVFDNIVIAPTESVCGDSVKLTADVFNIGDDEQDQVKVNLRNTKLNLALSREIKDDLSEGDKKKIEFEFIVPENLEDGPYILELDSEYDYRSGTYRESSDDSTLTTLKVFGCKAQIPDNARNVAVSAKLDSDAISGEDLIVKVSVTNLGQSQSDFAIAASGYENWADLNSISERLINLRSGESKEITVSLNVMPDAEGEKSFIIEVRSGDKLDTREIAVNIKKMAGGGTGFKLDLGGNSLVWIIGIINVILIILIIVVAARISRR